MSITIFELQLDDKKNDDELRKVFDYAVQNNPCTLFDTAEVYGLGRSETLIGAFSKNYPTEKIQIATKFAALPWRTKADDVVRACEKSLARLNGRPIDVYQIHFPGAWNNEEYWDGLATVYERGLVKAVGVSNYGVDAVTACHDALAKRGIPLKSNQIQLSLLYPYALQNGLMERCKELNVEVLSYSPLALGMLTGKYTPESKPSGPRKAVYEKLITSADYENLLAVMRDIANRHSATSDGNTVSAATMAQVALNWTRAKGSIPIPGARTLSQVQSNYNALQWNLSNSEVQQLDAAAAKVSTFIQPNQGIFPKQDKNTGLIMFDS
jgi:pyridoxine 4-dehydrogenase